MPLSLRGSPRSGEALAGVLVAEAEPLREGRCFDVVHVVKLDHAPVRSADASRLGRAVEPSLSPQPGRSSFGSRLPASSRPALRGGGVFPARHVLVVICGGSLYMLEVPGRLVAMLEGLPVPSPLSILPLYPKELLPTGQDLVVVREDLVDGLCHEAGGDGLLGFCLEVCLLDYRADTVSGDLVGSAVCPALRWLLCSTARCVHFLPAPIRAPGGKAGRQTTQVRGFSNHEF